MYTAQNESEAAFLESVFFPNREREKEREKVFRVLLLLLLREGDDEQYSQKVHWNPSFFFLFVLTGVCDEEHVLSLSVVEEEVCRKREESNVARFFYLRFAFSRAQRSLFLRGFKGDDDHKILSNLWSFQAYLIIASALSLRTHTSAILFFFDPLAHAVFFTHTQKHTHTGAHRKHSFRWKHAGCIEHRHILW